MAFEELKARQSAMWGSGPYEKVAGTIEDVHDELVRLLEPGPRERWLDVATGTGAVAFRAARAGADVTGIDLAPALVDRARELAEAGGVRVAFETGDAEQLDLPDAGFDVVVSAFGCMFAPDHQAVAGELARVCRPGGRLALACWRPDGGIGNFFRVLAPFLPPPPIGAGNPFDWGREEHVLALLGDAFELEFAEDDSPFVTESAEAGWELFVTSYGPTKTLVESLDPDRRRELDAAVIDLLEQHRVDGGIRQSRTYLRTLGRRR